MSLVHFLLKFHIQNKIFQFNLKHFQNSFSTPHQIQIQTKMTDTNHLCDLWQHTIVKVFTHDSKSQLGLMLKQWIIFNKLENFNSILNYSIDVFTPSGNWKSVLHESTW